MSKVGVFSGVFDPVHEGHIAACKLAKDSLQLDKVILLLEKNPHRKSKTTSAAHRQKMLEIAVDKEPGLFTHDTGEDNLYFSSTLKKLSKQINGSEVVLIVGSDTLKHIADWPGISETKFELCVVERGSEDTSGELQELRKKLPKLKIHILEAIAPNVSSSVVKQNLAKAVSDKTINSEVVEYIRANNIY